MSGPVIQPIDSVPPPTGAALNAILQPWLVALSTLPGPLVRPAFQSEPPDIPDAGEAWMAFRHSMRPADAYPYLGFDPAGNGGIGAMGMQRHEEIHLLCSLYDLGVSGRAEALVTLMRDNMAVAQNVEYLRDYGMGMAGVGDLQPVPLVIKSRWQYRIDFPFVLRREIQRTYPIPSILAVPITIIPDTAPTRTFTVSKGN
jgi:hypothetical protein